jgi:hypothetical protein
VGNDPVNSIDPSGLAPVVGHNNYGSPNVNDPIVRPPDVFCGRKDVFRDGLLSGGLNPKFHPLPWNNPNLPKPWPPPDPILRPMEPPPIPEGFREKIELGPNGPQRGIEPDPSYTKNNLDSRLRGAIRALLGFLNDASDTAPGPVLPIIITFPGWQCYASRGSLRGRGGTKRARVKT